MNTFLGAMGWIAMICFGGGVYPVQEVTFEDAGSYDVGNPQTVTVGDMTGDGILDLVVASTAYHEVRVLEGLPDGTFREPPVTFAPHYAYTPYDVVLADFDEDGHLDVVVTNILGGTVSLMRGLGSGALAAGVPFPGGQTPRGVAAADVNNDDNLDLVIAAQGSNRIQVLLGNGAGGFVPGIHVTGIASPSYVAPGDFDLDGNVDLAIVSSQDSTIRLRFGDGTGLFQEAIEIGMGVDDQLWFISARDLDEDGYLDLIFPCTLNSALAILKGLPEGFFEPADLYPAGDQPRQTVVGKFDLDSMNDFVVVNVDSQSISLYHGLGQANFMEPQDWTLGGACVSLAEGDFDGDGRLDLVVSDQIDHTLRVFLNRDAAGFRRGDLNSNGAIDFGDAVELLNFVFLNSPYPCADTADIDDDGQLVVTDGILLLTHLFLQGPPPAPPTDLLCSGDPTVDSLAPCENPSDYCP